MRSTFSALAFTGRAATGFGTLAALGFGSGSDVPRDKPASISRTMTADRLDLDLTASNSKAAKVASDSRTGTGFVAISLLPCLYTPSLRVYAPNPACIRPSVAGLIVADRAEFLPPQAFGCFEREWCAHLRLVGGGEGRGSERVRAGRIARQLVLKHALNPPGAALGLRLRDCGPFPRPTGHVAVSNGVPRDIRKKYRGKYPGRICAVWTRRGLPGCVIAQANNGAVYQVAGRGLRSPSDLLGKPAPLNAIRER